MAEKNCLSKIKFVFIVTTKDDVDDELNCENALFPSRSNLPACMIMTTTTANHACTHSPGIVLLALWSLVW